MTSSSSTSTAVSNASTAVSNVATPFASCSKQDDEELWNACWTDDEALWNMWASAMLYPPDTPEEVKKSRVQMLLRIGRDRAGAIEYVKNAKRTLALQADLPQMGTQCPKEDILCKTVEFDNIKIFYHPMWPNPRVGDGWYFYIARPGASTHQCIDWASERISIEICGMDGRWVECKLLMVQSHARIRISYTFKRKQCMREIVFPNAHPSVPTLYLEGM